jgi:hypothetical protein
MNQVIYSVAHSDGRWTVRFSGRRFDEFQSKQEAIETALEWARNAPQRQNILVNVSLEHEDGRTDLLDPRLPA